MRSIPSMESRVASFALVCAVITTACGVENGTMLVGGGDEPDAAATGVDRVAPRGDVVSVSDAGAPRGDVNEPAREVCDNGLDDDGDGHIDEDCPCLPGAMQSCFVGRASNADRGPCARGTQRCEGTGEFGDWGACEGSGAPQLEQCDQVDNDCDGEVDEGCICQIGDHRRCYSGAPATRGIGTCHDGDQTCVMGPSGSAVWGACMGEQLPGAETCDSADNNCDGRFDETCACRPGATQPCYDGTAATNNVGSCRSGVRRCVIGPTQGSAWGACDMQTLPSTEDCDDHVDNDCNGRTDCADARCTGELVCRPCMTGGQRFTLSATPADVLFVVDRSGSMNERTLDGTTRWNALVSAMRAVLPPLDASLYMGLVIYPEPDTCAVPAAPMVPIVQPAAGVIASYLAGRGPVRTALTPTLGALQTAERTLRSTTSPRRRFIVLATDGAPNCGSGVAEVVSQIQRIRTTLNVDTFVLGIPGADITLYPALNALAVAGGHGRGGLVQFYEAGSTSEFESALRAITATAVSCTYRLGTTPTRPDLVSVQFDGRTIARDGTNGWQYTDTTSREIRFNGTACRTLQAGSVRTVNASFNCG